MRPNADVRSSEAAQVGRLGQPTNYAATGPFPCYRAGHALPGHGRALGASPGRQNRQNRDTIQFKNKGSMCVLRRCRQRVETRPPLQSRGPYLQWSAGFNPHIYRRTDGPP